MGELMRQTIHDLEEAINILNGISGGQITGKFIELVIETDD